MPRPRLLVPLALPLAVAVVSAPVPPPRGVATEHAAPRWTAAASTTAVPAAVRQRRPLTKQPTAVGSGGAVATVDADATRVGLTVLRRGGNAVDAAVAAAATLGVTEPFSAGIGGGGYFVYYHARTRTVRTIDGRETAPRALRQDSFVDPATGAPFGLQEARVSGLSVGVPGTLATWDQALRRWGTTSLRQALRPATRVARRGFVVDQTFHDQIAADPNNPTAFATFSSTKALYLPGGAAPAVGSVFRNPDLAATYREIGRRGSAVFYRGPVGRDLVRAVRRPPLAATPSGWPYAVRPGGMTGRDLAAYDTVLRAPTHVRYRGLDVYGMAPSSSGGTTVGEALNILRTSRIGATDRVAALHRYLEASALAFADRNAYVGDPAHVAVPTLALTSRGFAAERACLISPTSTLARPVAPGSPDGSYAPCATPAVAATGPRHEGLSTTNLTVADRWGNVVEHTLTIEQTGGSAIVVPHRGFLLNNELTDFSFQQEPGARGDPNLPAAGKRPRSSISPTVVLRRGRPYLAVGTPGGASIITTVLQVLLERLDLGRTLPQAIAAPRASERNQAAGAQAEPAFLSSPDADALRGLGHTFVPTAEIGAATGVEFLRDGRVLAAAEPVRRGGGSAAVVRPAP